MHQNDRRFRSRMVADVDPVLVPLHNRLLVDHHSLRTEWHRTSDYPAAPPHNTPPIGSGRRQAASRAYRPADAFAIYGRQKYPGSIDIGPSRPARRLDDFRPVVGDLNLI